MPATEQVNFRMDDSGEKDSCSVANMPTMRDRTERETETLGVKSTDTPHATIYVSSEEEENAFTDGHAPVLFHSNDAVRRERRGQRPREEEGKEEEEDEEEEKEEEEEEEEEEKEEEGE